MIMAIRGVMLTIGASLVGSIIAKATIAAALGLIGAWFGAKAEPRYAMPGWRRRSQRCSCCRLHPSQLRPSVLRCRP